MSFVLLASMLAACGGKSDSKSQSGTSPSGGVPSSAPKENVELTWCVDAREDLQTIYEGYKADFEKANPNVKINIVKTPDDKINERISIAVNTNQMPDVQEVRFSGRLLMPSAA